MANIKSAKKRVLVSRLRQERNKANKTALKTVVKKVRTEYSDENYKTAVIALDKAVGKGLIHKNKANRLKSRLSKLSAK